MSDYSKLEVAGSQGTDSELVAGQTGKKIRITAIAVGQVAAGTFEFEDANTDIFAGYTPANGNFVMTDCKLDFPSGAGVDFTSSNGAYSVYIEYSFVL